MGHDHGQGASGVGGRGRVSSDPRPRAFLRPPRSPGEERAAPPALGAIETDSEAAARADAVFAALSDGTRRAVVAILAEGEAVTATGIAAQLPVSRQAVAKHLQILCEAGLVSSERTGRETCHRLTPEPLGDAMAWMMHVGAEWDVRLADLQRLLARRRKKGPQDTGF